LLTSTAYARAFLCYVHFMSICAFAIAPFSPLHFFLCYVRMCIYNCSFFSLQEKANLSHPLRPTKTFLSSTRQQSDSEIKLRESLSSSPKLAVLLQFCFLPRRPYLLVKKNHANRIPSLLLLCAAKRCQRCSKQSRCTYMTTHYLSAHPPPPPPRCCIYRANRTVT
jgi:hypothetical protein